MPIEKHLVAEQQFSAAVDAPRLSWRAYFQSRRSWPCHSCQEKWYNTLTDNVWRWFNNLSSWKSWSAAWQRGGDCERKGQVCTYSSPRGQLLDTVRHHSQGSRLISQPQQGHFGADESCLPDRLSASPRLRISNFTWPLGVQLLLSVGWGAGVCVICPVCYLAPFRTSPVHTYM